MKEYLLLRNNKQTGPYSLDDLRNLGLKTFDLIWVDKRSSAWRYPSEIKELMAIVSAVENSNINSVNDSAQKIFSISNNASFSKSDSENYTYKQSVEVSDQPISSHVVTLKPTVNNTRIRTIKSNASRNIVQVQVRTESTPTVKASAISEENTEAINSGLTILPEHTGIPEPISNNSFQTSPVWENANTAILSPRNQYISDNRLELAVLVIGAISLLAIVFLLVTSPY